MSRIEGVFCISSDALPDNFMKEDAFLIPFSNLPTLPIGTIITLRFSENGEPAEAGDFEIELEIRAYHQDMKVTEIVCTIIAEQESYTELSANATSISPLRCCFNRTFTF